MSAGNLTELNRSAEGVAPIENTAGSSPVADLILVRYGSVPQVARFQCPETAAPPGRSAKVVVETDRGEEIGEVLEILKYRPAAEQVVTGAVIRIADARDLQRFAELRHRADQSFFDWHACVREWKLELELIDLEITLDEKTVLYVLNDRNAETTRLALLAAATGRGIVIVQPVTAEGVVPLGGGGGGCGSGGCGSGGCGSH